MRELIASQLLFKDIFVPFTLIGRLWPVVVVIFFFSVVLHEVAHGYVAYLCGDNTARDMGRITLNPLAHIDLFGTLIVPVMLYMLGGFIIGWAKPVPINPNNFRNIKQDVLKVGASGPLTNFTLAVIFSLILWILNLIGFSATPYGFTVTVIIASAVSVNIILGMFNLVPIPPLDGSRIVSSLLPYELSVKYDRLAPFGFIILILSIRILWPVVISAGNVFYKMLFMGMPI
ncbi:site-2 protease family protein [Elusimicrobiota bacterium]